MILNALNNVSKLSASNLFKVLIKRLSRSEALKRKATQNLMLVILDLLPDVFYLYALTYKASGPSNVIRECQKDQTKKYSDLFNNISIVNLNGLMRSKTASQPESNPKV